jgi:5'-nucleotidase/UDP-sugar diphosphatase
MRLYQYYLNSILIKKISFILAISILITVCSLNDNDSDKKDEKNLTIFFINDQHGQIDNFSKIKQIVDAEKQENNVILACSGDIFSGNPVVDNYENKGYPIIDIMNQIGFDISAIGNHEFDYGVSLLKERMEQAEFDWICANINMGSTGIPEPLEYKTIDIDELKITFLGLIETSGKQNAIIPSTHPWKVQDFIFEKPEDVVNEYANVKEQENADLYIALTHLGYDGYGVMLGDIQLAQQFPYFDLIIGGHSHDVVDTVVNNIPIFQAGDYLNYLGKIEMSVKNKHVKSIDYELIDLNNYTNYDIELKAVVDGYNNSMSDLSNVIGYAYGYHQRYQVGCFYTDALRNVMNVDLSFQNTGGIRADLDNGDITKREIYEIDPFNNGTIIYNMTISEIKTFLTGSASGFYYSGMQIEQIGSDIQIKDLNGNLLSDDSVISVGINDYIPAVHDTYFPTSGVIQSLTSAETIIYYLENINDQVDYTDNYCYFRYQ